MTVFDQFFDTEDKITSRFILDFDFIAFFELMQLIKDGRTGLRISVSVDDGISDITGTGTELIPPDLLFIFGCPHRTFFIETDLFNIRFDLERINR